MIKAFGNYAKIEVIEEYKGVVRNDASEQQHMGYLREVSFMADHLTESGGYKIEGLDAYSAKPYDQILGDLVDHIVYYQEYSDSGRKFTEDGKEFVMVPWYRIYGYEEAK